MLLWKVIILYTLDNTNTCMEGNNAKCISFIHNNIDKELHVLI